MFIVLSMVRPYFGTIHLFLYPSKICERLALGRSGRRANRHVFDRRKISPNSDGHEMLIILFILL